MQNILTKIQFFITKTKFSKNNLPRGFAPTSLRGAVARARRRFELRMALDLFGSFSIKGKGTKNCPRERK